jgi:hypothetical protein
MALFFANQKCPLCQKEMDDIAHLFAFQAFISNTLDPFYPFNDSVFHLECLKEHPLGNRAIKFADQFFFSTHRENRICIVGKNIIKNFEDYIFIDLLTSDEQEALYKFNFITLDRNNLEGWTDRSKFIATATKFKEENKWGDLSDFKYLDYLIEIISQ